MDRRKSLGCGGSFSRIFWRRIDKRFIRVNAIAFSAVLLEGDLQARVRFHAFIDGCSEMPESGERVACPGFPMADALTRLSGS